MRIAMVTAEYVDQASGGIASHVYYLSRALARRGHEVDLVTSVRAPPAMDPPPGVRLRLIPFFQGLLLRNVLWTIGAKMAVRKLLGESAPDIVHAHVPMCSAYPVIHDRSIPLATTFHSVFYYFREIPDRSTSRILQARTGEIIDRTSLARSDVVIACSDSVRNEILNTGFPGERVVVVPNGVPWEDFEATYPAEDLAEVRRRYRFPARKFTILSVGELVPRKGHDVLIDAMRELDRVAPGTYGLVIVGDGADRHRLAGMARELDGSVVLAGRVPLEDLRKIYQAVDLFAMPSYYEGLPTVVLEALSSGLQVIGADIPSMRGLLGQFGILVERDPRAYAEGISRLLANTQSTQRKKVGARKAAEKFSWSKLAEATERAYEDAIARAG